MDRADERSVRERTGQAIGGVAPVGHPHTVFPTTYAELVRITGGIPADVGE